MDDIHWRSWFSWRWSHTKLGPVRVPQHTSIQYRPSYHNLLIAHPHLLVRATSERFLSIGGTFGVGLASESHWLQLVLVLTVHWWPTPISVGGLLGNALWIDEFQIEPNGRHWEHASTTRRLSSRGPMWRSRPVGHTRSSSIMDISSSSCIWMMTIHGSLPFECSIHHTSSSSTRIGHSLDWTLMSPDIHPDIDGWFSSIFVPPGVHSSFPYLWQAYWPLETGSRTALFIPHPHIHPESTHIL